MTVWPCSIRALKERSSLLMSWKWSPVVGSSKIKTILSLVVPLPINEASLILWASPPERVVEGCPSATYPKPTSWRGLSFWTILLWFSFSKKSMASSTLISSNWSNDKPLNSTSKTSFLNLFPLQCSHCKTTSAMNCISMIVFPSPLQWSQRPPSTLKEKCLAW